MTVASLGDRPRWHPPGGDTRLKYFFPSVAGPGDTNPSDATTEYGIKVDKIV